MSFLFEELSREECEAIREQDGYERGRKEGKQAAEKMLIKALAKNGMSAAQIADAADMPEEKVKAYLDV